MVGRSSRTQGIQSGHVFCNNSTCLKREPGISYLIDREKKVGADMGPQIANALVRIWPGLNEDEKKVAVKHFKGTNWQKPKEVFETMPNMGDLKDKLDQELQTE